MDIIKELGFSETLSDMTFDTADGLPEPNSPEHPDDDSSSILLGVKDVTVEAFGRVGGKRPDLVAHIMDNNMIRIDCKEFWVNVHLSVGKRKASDLESAEPQETIADDAPSGSDEKRIKSSRCVDCSSNDSTRECDRCNQFWCETHFQGHIALHSTGTRDVSVCGQCINKRAPDLAWEEACENLGLPWP